MKQDKWKVEKVSLEKIVPAELNANEMSEEDFQQLCENIGISGLSSVPTCYRRESDGMFVTISGHHRIKAAEKEGYTEIYIMYAEERDFEPDEIVAIQLSHNSLHGEDNKGILKRLFESIKTVQFKKFAHIDMNEIGTIDIESVNIFPMRETYNVSVVLYKQDIRLLEELTGCVREALDSSEYVILADQEKTEDAYLALMKEVGQKFNIRSSNIAFAKILELAKKQIEYESCSSN